MGEAKTIEQRLPDDFIESVKYLCVCARTTGGVAGRDEGLCRSLDRVEAMLVAIQDPDWQAQAKGKYRPHIHDDDGTVEGCAGCFP